MPAQIAARTRGDSSGGQQLTVAALAAAPPPVQKQMICARLFPAVSKYQPELAGKITGILLEMDNSELLILLDNEHQLKAKVDEAVRVLEQAVPAANAGGGSGGGQQLTVAALAAAPPGVQKQMIGERLFPTVSKYQPELAGKITGMILEMDNSELLILLNNEHQLKAKVDEAVRVLEQAVPAANAGGGSGGGQQLTVAALAAAPPPVQKQMIGERLFPTVYKYQPELAGKITGILLEMDNSELLILLDSEHQLKAKVDEAVRVLEQAVPAANAGGGSGGGQQLTVAALAAAPPPVQKQMIGERLFPTVSKYQPELAGKITGMMLEMDNSELLILLDNEHQLKAKVDEAMRILEQDRRRLRKASALRSCQGSR